MSTHIKVVVRVRPFLESEKKLNMKMSKLFISPDERQIKINSEDFRTSKTFKFDKVFDENTNQKSLYDDAQIDDLINKVVEGYHSTLFAYGHTGSGKTYTMEGYRYDQQSRDSANTKITSNPEDLGIIPRAIHSLFETIKSHQKLFSRMYTVTCSYIQIYNEKIFDLLNPAQLGRINPNSTGLRMRWNPKEEFVVENLFVFQCKTAEDAIELFHSGLRNKIMASHKMNIASSRSHSILSFKVESINLSDPDNITVSKLDLVDLAGSERSSLTGNEANQALKESIEINKSLFTLRQVITILSDPVKEKRDRAHAPYRDSKLTCLLKQGIGGNSYCLMIACLSPSDRYHEENVSTLTYASRASIISNEPICNEDPKSKLIAELWNKMRSFSWELSKANDYISFLANLVSEKSKVFGAELFFDMKSEENTESKNKGKKEDSNKNSLENSALSRKQSANFFNSITGSPKVLYDKLMESINTARELLKVNQSTRTQLDKAMFKLENLTKENMVLQQENQELREKLGVFENMLGKHSDETKNLEDLIQKTLENDFVVNQSAHGLAKELVSLRREKKQLETRVHDIELVNTELQQKLQKSPNFDTTAKFNESSNTNLDALTKFMASPNRTRRFNSVSPAARAQNNRMPVVSPLVSNFQTNESINVSPFMKQMGRRGTNTLTDEVNTSIDVRTSIKRKDFNLNDEGNYPLRTSGNETPLRSRIKPTKPIPFATDSDVSDRFNTIGGIGGAVTSMSPSNYTYLRTSFDKK